MKTIYVVTKTVFIQSPHGLFILHCPRKASTFFPLDCPSSCWNTVASRRPSLELRATHPAGEFHRCQSAAVATRSADDSAWRKRARRRSGHLETQWPRAPGPAAQVAGNCAGVSQDGGSGPWGPRALSPSRKRSVANGSGARSASVPPALSGPISAWTLGQTLMPTQGAWREECHRCRGV